MGHIKEPNGVDLIIGPSVVTERDKKMISEVIRYYKRTGKVPNKTQLAALQGGTTYKRQKRKLKTNRKKSVASK